jgi:glycosyltransferase involved in cell wall biosynthesis
VEKLESKFLSPLFNITLGQIYGKLLAETDAIVFVSNYQRDTITKLMPNISDKSYVIYNPIPSIEEEEDGVEGQDYGFYGGTSILKGFQILLEGLRLLDKHVKVHVAGRTDERFMVNNSQLTYHGWLNSSAYYELIKRTKVTIFPSISPEPCPYVILESMLYGKLVIASEIGAIPEITKGAPGVFLFPAGDSVSLSKRVEQIELMDRDTLLELGRKNRDLIRHRFRNDKTIEGLLRIIDRVVD